MRFATAAAAACMGDGTNKGLAPLLAGGSITFYNGTYPGASTVENMHTSQTNFGTYVLPTPTITNGTISWSGITFAAANTGTGTPTWFQITTSGGSPLVDGSVGQTGSGSDITFTTTSWSQNATIVVSTLGITIPSES